MVDSAGRPAIVGHTEHGASQRDSIVARFTPEFALDSWFGGDGVVTSDLSGAFREDRFDNVFDRSGKIVAVGGKIEAATGANLLMTAQFIADLPYVTPTPPAPDLCTPAKKRLSALKKKLKKQKKALKKAKSAAKRKKLKRQIRSTNKRIKKARASVRRLCTT
jgi:hypothetical protein